MAARSKALIVFAVVTGVVLAAVPIVAAQGITVTSASPASAAQGTLGLAVTVSGKNFKANSTVTAFYRVDTEEDTGGVVAGRTTYKRSSQLIVLIDVPETAQLGSYDVVVTTNGVAVRGRALFTVQPKAIPPCTTDLPTPTDAPTQRDPSFGVNGVVVGPKFMEATAVAIQRVEREDGTKEERIVTVGSSWDTCAGSDRVWMIARYLATGEPDPDFGQNGVVTKKFAKGPGWLYAVAIDAQNRIVVGGYVHFGSSANYGVVARFSPDGVLDTGFAANGLEPGIRSLSLERYMTDARAFVIQQDGKIVIAGTDGGAMAVFRLTENGAWDTAEFNAGATRPQMPGRYVYLGGIPGLVHGPGMAYGVAIQGVGEQQRIVVAGKVNVQRPDDSIDGDGAVWRFTMGGHLDSGFGTSGVVTTDVAGKYDVFQAMALDASGKIVVTGSVSDGSPSYLTSAVLARYDPNGTLDSGFNGGEPIVIRQLGWAAHYPYALAIDSAGNILVGESSYKRDAGNRTVADGAGLWRFTSYGDLDTEFGPGGWIHDTLLVNGQYATWNGLAVQEDGNVIAVGKSKWGAYYPVLTRFLQ